MSVAISVLRLTYQLQLARPKPAASRARPSRTGSRRGRPSSQDRLFEADRVAAGSRAALLLGSAFLGPPSPPIWIDLELVELAIALPPDLVEHAARRLGRDLLDPIAGRGQLLLETPPGSVLLERMRLAPVRELMEAGRRSAITWNAPARGPGEPSRAKARSPRRKRHARSGHGAKPDQDAVARRSPALVSEQATQ
jgi:hypothetical protein